MVQEAILFSVMVASPGDVQLERKLALDAITEWNGLYAIDTSLVLQPRLWELHSVPEMGARPQQIINRQLLDDCDLLVAIFWTRLGTPTATELSGTVEEIKRHMEAGKPAIIYFSKTPVEPDSIDRDQYERLKDFKAWCTENGLIKEYAEREKFGEIFLRDLIRTFSSHPYFQPHVENMSSSREAEASSAATSVPTLSDDAQALLAAAAQDQDGSIMQIRSFQGLTVAANGLNFIEKQGPEEEARWKAALEELERLRFVEPTSARREIFRVTHQGYQQNRETT